MQTLTPKPHHLRVVQSNNRTYDVFMIDVTNMTSSQEVTYDSTGAMYYVIAVVLIYGFSIILMIGSLIKKSRQDNGLSRYMEDMDKIRLLERRHQKFLTRMAMQKKGKIALKVNGGNINYSKNKEEAVIIREENLSSSSKNCRNQPETPRNNSTLSVGMNNNDSSTADTIFTNKNHQIEERSYLDIDGSEKEPCDVLLVSPISFV